MRSMLLAAALGAGVALGTLAAAGGLTTLGLLRAPAQAATPAPPPPAALSPLARDLLGPRMQRHGADLQDLALAVTVLQRDRTREIALQIAHEPRLVKLPGAGANELESTLPDRFFTLQDQARLLAFALADQASRGDDHAVARAFAELQQTCVSCHASYLRPGPAPGL